MLAQPLIEDWIVENRGPAARARESARALLDRLERLPGTLDDLEAAARHLAQGAVRVDPDSLRHLGRQNGTGAWAWPTLALVLAAALVAALLA